MSEQTFDANEYKAGQGREWGRSATAWKQCWDIWEKGAQHINERLVELAQLKRREPQNAYRTFSSNNA